MLQKKVGAYHNMDLSVAFVNPSNNHTLQCKGGGGGGLRESESTANGTVFLKREDCVTVLCRLVSVPSVSLYM